MPSNVAVYFKWHCLSSKGQAEDLYGGYNSIFKPFRHINMLAPASDDITMVETAFSNLTGTQTGLNELQKTTAFVFTNFTGR